LALGVDEEGVDFGLRIADCGFASWGVLGPVLGVVELIGFSICAVFTRGRGHPGSLVGESWNCDAGFGFEEEMLDALRVVRVFNDVRGVAETFVDVAAL
jgi:hypothetical protein